VLRLSRTLALLLVATLGVACSISTGTPGSTATGAGLKVTLPEGWTSGTVSGRGLVVASSEKDLNADVPTGPRLVASPASGALPDPVALFATAKSERSSVRAKPESVTVDGHPGIVVEVSLVRGGVSIVSRQVVVEVGPGTAYTLTLEAPKGQWDANKSTLQDILDSIRFI
jgi:hypothetical protein